MNTSSQHNIPVDPLKDAINYCIYLLARREYSQYELQNKLKSKGFSDTVIADCLSNLTDNNYQSDTRFAEMFVRSRVNQKYGPKKIMYELSQKGIDEALAINYLSHCEDEFLDNAQQLIIRKAPRGELATTMKDWKLKSKITRFLVGRGYQYDTINLGFEILQSEEIDE